METFEDAYRKALACNYDNTQRWQLYRDDHLHARENLENFQKHLSLDIMVPLGSRALVPGQLYHTGEVLVSHFQGIYSKCTAHQAIQLSDKRIKLANENLESLEVEHDLLVNKLEIPFNEDAFRSLNEQEIIETYNEESEKEWRERHRVSVKMHKQKEAEERNRISTTSSDPELFDRLDELELIEELNDELNEHNEEMIIPDDIKVIEKIDEIPNKSKENSEIVKKKVRFAEELESNVEIVANLSNPNENIGKKRKGILSKAEGKNSMEKIYNSMENETNKTVETDRKSEVKKSKFAKSREEAKKLEETKAEYLKTEKRKSLFAQARELEKHKKMEISDFDGPINSADIKERIVSNSKKPADENSTDKEATIPPISIKFNHSNRLADRNPASEMYLLGPGDIYKHL